MSNLNRPCPFRAETQLLSFTILLLSISVPRTAFAQEACPGTVIFSSGIDTDQVHANLTVQVLRDDLQHFLEQSGIAVPNECFVAFAATPQGRVKDIIESASQIAESDLRHWWRQLFGLEPPSLEFE